MAKFTFTCPSCGKKTQKYVSSQVKEIPCDDCLSTMTRQLPSISGQQTTEVIDSLTGVSWKQDQKELIQERKDDYYWTVIVPRLIQTHCVETCLENSWLIYDEKGNLVINKPPSKR